MALGNSLAPLGSEFDSFLFAPICDDKNSVPLSVVSALARLDVDPWEEAGALARLPRDAAVQRMASWIAASPDALAAQLDPRMIAGRLVALLPRQVRSVVPPSATLPGAGLGKQSRVVSYAFVIFIVLMMGAQIFMAGRLSQAKFDGPAAPASGTVAADVPTAGQ
jgi:hypothetical protein